MQTSPAKLGTSLVVGSCYVSSVCYQVAPCRLDQGADLGQHVRGLDKYMADDVGKLSLNFLDPATGCFLHFSAGSGTTACTLHLAVHVLIFLVNGFQLSWGPAVIG